MYSVVLKLKRIFPPLQTGCVSVAAHCGSLCDGFLKVSPLLRPRSRTMTLCDGLSHCKLALVFAVLMDLLGGAALLVGVFARLEINGKDFGDLLVYTGTFVFTCYLNGNGMVNRAEFPSSVHYFNINLLSDCVNQCF